MYRTFTELFAIAKQKQKQKTKPKKKLKQTNIHQQQKREVKCIIFLQCYEIVWNYTTWLNLRIKVSEKNEGVEIYSSSMIPFP